MKESEKQDQILEAAIRRLAHFGVNKTTLTEIAEDLGMSKQALQYYFPDKQVLIAAVVEKIAGAYLHTLQLEIEQTDTIDAALQKLIDTRHQFFDQYYMLFSALETSESIRAAHQANLVNPVQEKEISMLTALFRKGIRKGELREMEITKTVKLLLDTISAFSRCFHQSVSLPDVQLFREVARKQKEVMHIFYHGLKASAWK